ncbi:hypothetical protein DFH11DRAFT_1571377 [Phellopilus nigrolimitatus]|nr:hypothetical protein DFH11DRAFT_1571377 [Phellopilus nigrolimitatus]
MFKPRVSQMTTKLSPVTHFFSPVPLVAFLVFATEKDVLSAWCFWRKGKSTEQSQPRTENPALHEEGSGGNGVQC